MRPSKYIKLWLEWTRHCSNDWIHKILVLLKLRHSPTFEMYRVFSDDDIRKFGDFREWR